MDHIIGKKRKVFSYSPETFTPIFQERRENCEGLARHHNAKQSNDDESREASARNQYIEMIQKSLYEFNRLQMLLNHLKGKEVLGLQTCVKSATVRNQIQTINEKIDIRKESLVKCEYIMSKGLIGARALVLARRSQCRNSLELRKSWRVVVEATQQNQFLTFDQKLMVDCSIETAVGDTHAIPSGLLQISTGEDCGLIDSKNVQYTIQTSLAHNNGGILCTQTLWHLLYGTYPANESSISILDERCRKLYHDRRARLIFQVLATGVPGNVGCTSSLGADCNTPEFTEGNVIERSFLEEPLCEQLFFTCISRCEVRIALSESWTLVVAMVPINLCKHTLERSFVDANTMALDLLRSCEHMIGLACLSLDSVIAGRTNQVLAKVSMFKSWSLFCKEWKCLREDTNDLSPDPAYVATLNLVRMIQHRIMLARVMHGLRAANPGVQINIVSPDSRGTISLVVVTLETTNRTSAFQVNHSVIEIISTSNSSSHPLSGIQQTVEDSTVLLNPLPLKNETFSFSSLASGVVSQCEMRLRSIPQLLMYLHHNL